MTADALADDGLTQGSFASPPNAQDPTSDLESGASLTALNGKANPQATRRGQATSKPVPIFREVSQWWAVTSQEWDRWGIAQVPDLECDDHE